MRIYVDSKDGKIFLPIPNAVLCSAASARLAAAAIKQSNAEEAVPLDYKTIRAAQKILRQCIRIHGHFPLVDVEAADGDKVKIVL